MRDGVGVEGQLRNGIMVLCRSREELGEEWVSEWV